jgi:AAA domain
MRCGARMPDDDGIARIEDYQSSLLQQPRRFRLVRFAAIKFQTARRYLIHGLIPSQGLVVIWGPPKCGKSFWIFDLTMHVALGWEYRGRRVQASSVVYIACEGEAGLAARKEAFQQAKIAEDSVDPPFYLLTTRLNLVGEIDELIADIDAQLHGEKCGAVVIDTLNRSLVGSESRDEDMAAYIQAADQLRERFGCVVVIVHHCGINGERPRGHTSLTGAADAQISVKRVKGGGVLTEVEWMKDGEEGQQTASRLDVITVGTDEDGEPITSCVVWDDDRGASQTTHRPRKLSVREGRALQLLAESIQKTASSYRPLAASLRTRGRCARSSGSEISTVAASWRPTTPMLGGWHSSARLRHSSPLI